MRHVSIQQTLAQAVRHHQAGQLREAEQLYRRILSRQPDHFDAIHRLAIIADLTGRHEVAVELLRRAVSLRPNFAIAYNTLGIALGNAGQIDESIAAYRRSIGLNPNLAEAEFNRGNALRVKGDVDEAIAAFERVVALRPDTPDAHLGLGNALSDKRQYDQAIAAYRKALALQPNHAYAHNNLGTALKSAGRLDEAMAEFQQALALQPNLPDAHFNLGNVHSAQGRIDDAIGAYRHALALRPNFLDAMNNLGIVLAEKGNLDEAIELFRKSITLEPRSHNAHNQLGITLRDQGRLDEAVAELRQAIALKPDFPEAYTNLGGVLKDQGDLSGAIVAYRQAAALRPGYTGVESNLIYTLYFHPGYDAHAIAQELRRFDREYAQPLARFIPKHGNDRNPDRPLRIGYVAPDFRDHCQALFTVPLLSHHDHQNFQIICYADVSNPDNVTARLRGFADLWRSTVGASDEQLAAQILDDKIDVLVDLTMHMARNRLLVFARKPAPVQVCWLAYPASTGLSAIDYRLSDPYLDPPGADESVYSEQTIRLPDSFWCYNPLSDAPLNELPADSNGYITFGCLNNFCKINDNVRDLWLQVLKKVENSRLVLLSPPGSHQQRSLDQFAKNGIDSGRIQFVPRQPRPKYLLTYHQIDVGLDSFPYNGHTTSLDSFWMGVPVVTLVGQTPIARAGWCQLSNLGLAEMAAHRPEQFVQIAADLAADLPRLKALRRSLRKRMEQSPLMDAPRFARNIQTAYRQMWQQWIATHA